MPFLTLPSSTFLLCNSLAITWGYIRSTLHFSVQFFIRRHTLSSNATLGGWWIEVRISNNDILLFSNKHDGILQSEGGRVSTHPLSIFGIWLPPGGGSCTIVSTETNKTFPVRHNRMCSLPENQLRSLGTNYIYRLWWLPCSKLPLTEIPPV